MTKREKSRALVLLSGAIIGWILVGGLALCIIGAVFGLVYITLIGVLLLWASVVLIYRFMDGEP